MKPKIGNPRSGGAGSSEGNSTKSESSTRRLLIAIREELDDLRLKYAALLAKLDLDTGVAATNHAATVALEEEKFVK